MTSTFGNGISILGGLLVGGNSRRVFFRFPLLAHNTQPLSAFRLLHFVSDFIPCVTPYPSPRPITMGKTSASIRAGRKSKPKQPERRWCTCQERCDGGKDVAASTYRSHNPTTRPTTTRDGCMDDPVAVVGGKRKAESDVDRLVSGGGVRETRRMRARRIAQDEGSTSQPSLAVAEDLTSGLDLDDVRPQESKTVGRTVHYVPSRGLTDNQARAPRSPGSRLHRRR